MKATALVASALLCATATASLVRLNVPVPDLVLKDGTHYANLTIRSYDPAIGQIMALQGSTFITLSTAALPPDVLKKLNAMVPPSAFEPEKPSTVTPAPYHPKPEVEATAPADKGQVDAGQAQEAKDLKAAKKIAETRAYNYFRYERSMGSGQVTVRSVRFEWDDGVAVPGWTRRYRFPGKAYIDYFDSVGDSFSRMNQAFEVTVEADSHGSLKAIDLTAH